MGEKMMELPDNFPTDSNNTDTTAGTYGGGDGPSHAQFAAEAMTKRLSGTGIAEQALYNEIPIKETVAQTQTK